MNAVTNEAAATPATAKVLTVIDDMPQRRIFATPSEALAYLEKCGNDYADFAGYPVAIAGLSEEGDFDPAVYNEAAAVCVSVVTKRGDGPNSTKVHAISIFPAPTLESILADTAGVEWLNSIVAKELNHVAVRNIRKATTADEIADAVPTMPTSLADFVTSGRESTSSIVEAFNATWQLVKKGIGAKFTAFALRNLSKKELRKAMESASYAAAMYPELENRTNKQGQPESLFVLAATFGGMIAKRDSLDATIYERALANRNDNHIAIAADEDEGEFDLEAMAAALTAPAAEATEADAG